MALCPTPRRWDGMVYIHSGLIVHPSLEAVVALECGTLARITAMNEMDVFGAFLLGEGAIDRLAVEPISTSISGATRRITTTTTCGDLNWDPGHGSPQVLRPVG